MGSSTAEFTEEAAEAAFLFFAGGQLCVIVAAGRRGRLGPATLGPALLVIGIGFAAVEGAAGGLGFFLGLETAGEGFVGGGVGLGGVRVVGA